MSDLSNRDVFINMSFVFAVASLYSLYQYGIDSEVSGMMIFLYILCMGVFVLISVVDGMMKLIGSNYTLVRKDDVGENGRVK